MRKVIFFFLLFLIFLYSCQLQKAVVNVYAPPSLLFPPDVRSVMVTSRYVPAIGPYEDVQWGAYESVDSLKWTLSESMVDTLASRMAAGKKFLVKVRHFPRMLRHNDASQPDPLPWQGLAELAKKEYVQALIVIEGFGLAKTPVAVSENSDNYLAQYSVEVKVALRVYEPEKMRTIDDSIYTFSSEFRGSGKSEQEAINQLPDDRRAMVTACNHAAEAYFSMINPREVKATRYFYAKGDSSMLLAGQAAREGKWNRAESKWKWLAYNARDSVIQAKASYNMALVCERDGRINQAMGFARRSQRLKPDNHTLEYINVLNNKILDYNDQIKNKKIIRRW